MTRWLLSGVLVLILAGFADREMDAAAVASSAEMKTQVFRYLDSTDADEAARTLQAVLSDPDATIDQAVRIIQTERIYVPQPTGTIPDERIDVQGRAYQSGALHSPDVSAGEELWACRVSAWRGVYR